MAVIIVLKGLPKRVPVKGPRRVFFASLASWERKKPVLRVQGS